MFAEYGFQIRWGAERLSLAEPPKYLQVIITGALPVGYDPVTTTGLSPRPFLNKSIP